MNDLNLTDETIKKLKDFNCKIIYIQPQHIVFSDFDVYYKCKMIDIWNATTIYEVIKKSTKPETIGDIKR